MAQTMDALILKIIDSIANVSEESRKRDNLITQTIVEMTITVARLASVIKENERQIRDLKVRIDYLETKDGE